MICRDHHIPEYRTPSSGICRGEKTPGSAVDSNPIYRTLLFSLFGKGLVAPAIEITPGALEATIGNIGVRRE